MKIKILRSTVAGGVVVEKDETVDVPDKDARLLIVLGKAEAAKEPKKESKSK